LVIVNDSFDTVKSYRNIPFVEIVDAAYVSVFDVLKARKILFIGDALDRVVEHTKKI
jgi:ribosomal protein L4